MITRKKALTLGVVVFVIATLSLSAVAYGALWWNPQSLANWMFNWGADYIRNTYNTVQYDIKPKVADIYNLVQKMDRETLEIEILPLEFTTDLGFNWPTPTRYQSTQIGGPDIYSDAYMVVTFRGARCCPDYVNATVMDGGLYPWEVEVIELDQGWYDVFVTAPYGVEAGSYMVQVEATLYTYPQGYSHGTGYYVIDCTVTTTEIIE